MSMSNLRSRSYLHGGHMADINVGQTSLFYYSHLLICAYICTCLRCIVESPESVLQYAPQVDSEAVKTILDKALVVLEVRLMASPRTNVANGISGTGN